MQLSTKHPEVFTKTLAGFLASLEGKNRSVATIQAYKTDVVQCLAFATQNSILITHPENITRTDMHDYLSFLSQRGLSGITRARKLVAIREYFRFLEGEGFI